ncbi:MAG: YbaB/EbfC family nucleoid-associated protein [Treponema sp.]|nr:YbaB/EbfC family nucleoid-associated protein [Treponema sp.]MBR1616218.1 YbaB/EbfC family nucleoid-associated protein [Treponema sp.]MBR1714177.1 YbaB/EbfC family nucleoid-associated protein [Treponema sp.]
MVNPFEMMKNLKNVEANAAKMKEELGRISATGSSGGNIVKVTLNGKFEMVSIEIDPIAQGDVPMLQDLIVAAHHNAMEKIQEAIKEKSGSLLKEMGLDGMNIPGFNA